VRAIGRKTGPIATLLVLAWMGVGPASASAAEPPGIESVQVEGVTATSATLHGSIDPKGVATTYRFEYLSEAAYLANLEAVPSGEGFEGAAWAPLSGAGSVGAGMGPVPVNQHVSGLIPSTPYRYRLRAAHSGEAVFSVVRPFGTEASTNVFELLDGRGWEMVSPLEKAGGAVQPPGAIVGGGVFQAAASGGDLTYSSADSFGAGVQGAPAGSQYVATRGAGGWSSSNITTPALSGSYGDEPDGVPYQLFSSDLSSALLSNGERCRGDAGGECPVANPPIPGSGAPAGYRDYYLRTPSGTFQALLTAADLSHSSLAPEQFELRLVAATPDLAHVVLSSCAALTANAIEVPAAGGCNSADQNLYEWSGGSLSLINLLPGEASGTPGAVVAAASGAVSADGSRVYFVIGTTVYLREGGVTKIVLESAGTSAFQVASSDGGVAYLVDAGVLYRYDAVPGTLTVMTSSTGVEGVLGISTDGAAVYYSESGAVFLRRGGAVTEVASSASPGDWPPATGTARVSADGSHLLFLSDAELTGFPNEGQMEVFLYGPATGGPMLTCVSCDPTGERPAGPSSIPGAIANGKGTQALDVYKPREMSADGGRVFFDSADDLVPQDTNSALDVYEWEADGSGTCARVGGCVQLISSGKGSEPAFFLDADADGGEAFFLTAESLYAPDPGSYDVYDARVGGGFAVPESPIPCTGDACQVLPEAPEDPNPGTLVPNSGNPPLRIAGEKSAAKKKEKKKHHKKRHHKHAKKSQRARHGKAGGGR
jgi:hypothetical protein